MQRARVTLSVVTCLALVAAEASGLHMHVDEHGYVGAPVGTHVHGAKAHAHGHAAHDHLGAIDHDDGDHARDRDVTAVELGAGVSKLLFWFVWLGVVLSFVVPRPRGSPIAPDFPTLRTERHRWRPPLRGPPLALTA